MDKRLVPASIILIVGLLLGASLQLGIIEFEEYVKIQHKSAEDAKVYVDKEVSDTLDESFTNNSKEFIYCLEGESNIQEGRYYVESLSETEVISAEEDSVEYEPCPSTSIGNIHSHPSGNCEMSKPDAFTFGRQGVDLIGIVCGQDDYAFYQYGDVYRRTPYQVKSL